MSDLVTVGGVTTSRLGFGCASLMRKSRKQRLSLLDTAFDSGIRHFDVAAMYGLGQTEFEIGNFVFAKRDQVTIATKFGLGVSRWLAPLGPFQDPIRAALERLPQARGAVRKRAQQPPPPRVYCAEDARRSLDASLRKLGTDYVDFLFVHDPRPSDEVRTGELLDFFTRVKQEGKIRAWGVSQDAHPKLTIVQELGESAVLQIRADVFHPVDLPRPSITFGIIGAAHARLSEALRRDFTARTRWSRELDVDLKQPEALARLLLADALAANPDGAVIYSTLSPDRLRAAALAGRVGPDPAQVGRVRELTRREFPHHAA